MNSSTPVDAVEASLEASLPFLRRYARALTGDQDTGDAHAMAALKRLGAEPHLLSEATNPRLGLFRACYLVWQETSVAPPVTETGQAAKAQAYLRRLTPTARQALLLYAIEDFSTRQIAEIMNKTAAEVDDLLEQARTDMKAEIAGKVMIVEDEALIADDLMHMVTVMGHAVVGVATTRSAAVKMAREAQPDLILVDIQLADGSSGIDAVADLAEEEPKTPVIFVTAFPELLLTGRQTEPAFLITKPYRQDQVQSAVSQAMFFRSSAEITA